MAVTSLRPESSRRAAEIEIDGRARRCGLQ